MAYSSEGTGRASRTGTTDNVAREPTVAREIESKYDIAPDFVMPDLERFAHGVATDTVNLSSTYYDTGDQDLLRYRLTLRHRAGDADTGWQLKIPGRGERTELHWPPGDEPPDELQALLRPFVRDKPLAPSLRLDFTRVRYRLNNADDELIAEIAHDVVRAVGLGAEVRAPRWHEVEIQPGPSSSTTSPSSATRWWPGTSPSSVMPTSRSTTPESRRAACAARCGRSSDASTPSRPSRSRTSSSGTRPSSATSGIWKCCANGWPLPSSSCRT